jgi:pimeloyl-ACP methyl ester carboxylesterase
MPLLDAISRTLGHFGIPAGKLGNVVYLPGVLGSDLVDQEKRKLWILPAEVSQLHLDPSGTRESPPTRSVEATTLILPYAALHHVLDQSWNVLAFAYDWRKDLFGTAERLERAVKSRFGDEPFHIVAHSMGGLAARVLRARFPGIQRGGKFVMLGTPNHGSFLAVQALTLDVAATALLRLYHVNVPPQSAMAAARTWPGVYQLLPCPLKDSTIQPFYSHPPAGLSKTHLDAAAYFHEFLDTNPVGDDAFYIGGSLIPTIDGLPAPNVNALTAFVSEGDGVVSHRLGFLAGLKTFTVASGHVDLPSNFAVLASITPLLHEGNHGLL